MADILPEGQVDQALTAILPGSGASEEASRPPDNQRRIMTYDFKRPDKFSRDQIRTVSIMHETFARRATAGLSVQLRSLAHVHVASVDQMTYEEFIRSIPNPTTLAIVNMDPLRGPTVLEIDPAVSFATVDRLFGGQGKDTKLTRELTEIEASVLEGIIVRMLGSLPEAWAGVIDLRPRLTRIETNPMFAQIVRPSEMIVLVTFETRIGDAEGMINFCIPYLTIEPVIHKLSAQYIYSTWVDPTRVFTSTASLPMAAEVCFEGDSLTLRALSELKKGTMIDIPRYGEGSAFLQAGGARVLQLNARRVRGTRRVTYSLSEQHVGKDLEILGAMGIARQEKKADVLEETLHSLSEEIGAAVRSIQGSIADLARKQEEISDHLLLPSPERDAGSVEHAEGRRRPFGSYTISDCEVLATFIGQEHPQLIALVLSYLDVGLSACVLASIPEELRTDVAERICTMGRTAPEVLREVERVLDRKISVLASPDYITAGGVQAIVEILNVASRSLEKGVVESLGKRDPRLAEEIKKRMFVFEDIVLLDRKAIALVVKEAQAADLLLSMKAASDEVRAIIWECVPKGDIDALKVRYESIGPVRLKDVEEAQQRIVAVVRRLDEEGRIVVARLGEDVVVK